MKAFLLKLRDIVSTAFAVVITVLMVTGMLAFIFPSVAKALDDFTVHAKVLLYAGNTTLDGSFFAFNNDSVRSQAPHLFNNTATFAGQITTSGTTVAVFDSFSTTSLTKAVTMTGATEKDIFIVTPIVTTYSTPVDTNAAFYYARYDSAGYVTVGRFGLLGQTVKSGAHFVLAKINKS